MLPPPELVGKAVVESPSACAEAPIPALANSTSLNGTPSRPSPANWTRNAGAPPLSAMTRSGSTGARAW